MKFITFLKENKVSMYKLAQLAGFDPAKYSGSTSRKVTGTANMPVEELASYCKGLSSYLKKDVKPEMFEFEVVELLMK